MFRHRIHSRKSKVIICTEFPGKSVAQTTNSELKKNKIIRFGQEIIDFCNMYLLVKGMSKISSRVILHTDWTALRKSANELVLVTFNSLVIIVKLEKACLKKTQIIDPIVQIILEYIFTDQKVLIVKRRLTLIRKAGCRQEMRLAIGRIEKALNQLKALMVITRSIQSPFLNASRSILRTG